MDATTAVQESTALNQVLPAPSSIARLVQKDGFKILQVTPLASKSNQATLSGKDAAHRFKFLSDLKFVVMVIILVLIKRLHLKLARQGHTAVILDLRRSVTTVKLENQVHKERRNVKNGMCI
jgi:hypothetical protein